MIPLGPIIAELVPAAAGALVAAVGYLGYRLQLARRPARRMARAATQERVVYQPDAPAGDRAVRQRRRAGIAADT